VIFDSTQFGSVKIFSYIFFWMGFIAVLYPPYIQIAKLEFIKNYVQKKIDNAKSPASKDAEKKPIDKTQPATPNAPQKSDQTKAPKDGALLDSKKDENEEWVKMQTSRTVSKEHLEEAPELKSKEKFWNFDPSKVNSSENPPAEQKKSTPNCVINYYEDTAKTREQMYSNVWKHFRSDYRRLNPITRQDGVIEFAQMIESSLASQQTTKPNRGMTRARPVTKAHPISSLKMIQK
jgi:hypothetical protein